MKTSPTILFRNLLPWLLSGTLLGAVGSVVTGCSDLNDEHELIDEVAVTLRQNVTLLDSITRTGWIVAEIAPLRTDNGGWELHSATGDTLRLPNGVAGITPYLRHDNADCWSVSYDAGATFASVSAEEAKQIVDETVTPNSIQSVNAVVAIVQDDRDHTVSLTLYSGEQRTFALQRVTPTEIVLLNPQPLHLSWGGTVEVTFSVVPATVSFDYDVQSDQAEIYLEQVSTTTESTPSAYRLSHVRPVCDEAGEHIAGQYCATITDGKSGFRYEDQVAFTIAYTDVTGEAVQLSSPAIGLMRTQLDSLHTGLPIVLIETPDAQPITSKETWITDAEMTIFNADGTLEYQGTLSMKGRGNSSWSFPKKPYSLKLDKKSKLLGMDKHKRWCLLANWADRTLMRNAVAFEIARQLTGLDWTPHGTYVELVLNGTHVGNYYLCEQIKVDENRVNVTELDPNATEGDGITGGYIFELDVAYDEDFKFHSSYRNMPWMFKDPDEVNEAQYLYAQDYVNAMEEALYTPEKFSHREFADYMELNSFADYWFVEELTMNWDCGFPKSVYMNKDVNGKMKAGPVWDFDYGSYNPYCTQLYTCDTSIYYAPLFKDELFRQLVKERWNECKSRLEQIPTYIDQLSQELAASDSLNSPMWRITSNLITGDATLSYPAAVRQLRAAYIAKYKWLNRQIQQY
jgi:hypothetical protein